MKQYNDLLLVLFLLVVTPFGSNAQDIIIYKNGTEIKVIVQEVGVDNIKYKKFDNLNGPIYTEKKGVIFMIKYKNGTKDVFGIQNTIERDENSVNNNHQYDNKVKGELLDYKRKFFSKRYYKGGKKIRKSEFIRLLKQDPEAYSYYSSYGTLKIFDSVFNGASWIFTIFAVKYSIEGDRGFAFRAALAGLGSGIISQVFSHKAKSKIELAVISYNNNLSRTNKGD